MKKPGKSVVIPALLFLAFAATALLLRHAQSKRLQHNGYSIHHWFKQLPLTIVVSSRSSMHLKAAQSMGQQYGNTNDASQVFKALDAFGTNGIPYYLAKLQSMDSSLEQSATKTALKNGVKSLPFRNAAIERAQAITALRYISPLSPDTLQILTNLSSSGQTDISAAAKFLLEHHGSPFPISF